jgi:GntR family transcriptional regulator
MDRDWNDSQPIYRQLHARIVVMILEGVLKEGAPLPSVRDRRRIADQPDHRPQGISSSSTRSWEAKRRIIHAGARERLLRAEREKFMKEEWPKVRATIQRLGLDAEELLHKSRSVRRSKGTHEER